MSAMPSTSQSASDSSQLPDEVPPPPSSRISVDFRVGEGFDKARLWSVDGWEYRFRDPFRYLYVAFSFRGSEYNPPNQKMAIFGDAQYKAILCETWLDNDDTIDQWQYYFYEGVSKNAFLAALAEQNGLREAMLEYLPVANGPSKKELATTMEALIGAVYKDCGGNTSVVREVMQRLGVWWPKNKGSAKNHFHHFVDQALGYP